MLFRRHKSAEAHRVVKDALMAGCSIYDALTQAGYSEKQARKGKAALPRAVFELMAQDELHEYENLGKQLLRNRNRLESFVVSFLYCRTLDGRTAGLKAVELLGRQIGILNPTPRKKSAQYAQAVIEAPH